MNSTDSSTATAARRVVSGKPDGTRWLLTLDGNQVVEVVDRAIFEAARQARAEDLPVQIDLERQPNGQDRVIELTVQRAAPGQALATREGSPSAGQVMARVPDLPTGLISQAADLSAQLGKMYESYNVLSPAIAVAEMAPGYGANLAVVRIDARVEFDKNRTSGLGADTYYSASLFRSDETKRALNKQGLLKIAQAAGVMWDRTHCRRLDDGKERHYWHWQYAGAVRTHDGQLMPVQGSRELDLRDGSPEAKGMQPKQREKARASGNELCESKAMLRAIRTLGVRQVYTVDELQKPFLVVRFSFTPDMADPEIKKLVTERALSGMGALYPEAPAPAALPPATAAQEGDGFGDAAPRQADAPAPATLPKGQYLVADVKEAGHGKRKDNSAWTRYLIVATTGESWSTFDDDHAKDARYAKEKGWPIRIEDKENERYPDQVDIAALTIIDPRQGTLPMGDQPDGGF